jgi:hypothetical protein
VLLASHGAGIHDLTDSDWIVRWGRWTMAVVVDNFLWPTRAKLDVRKEMAASLEDFRLLWEDTLSIFLQRATPDKVTPPSGPGLYLGW